MTTTTAHNAILEKTLELCQTILDQHEVQAVRRDIDAFIADEHARNQYQLVVEKSEALQEKQRSSQQPTPQEVEEFEKERGALMDNPVTRAFLDAQQAIHHVQQTVLLHVTKSIELGRVPTPEDFNTCQPGCSCGH